MPPANRSVYSQSGRCVGLGAGLAVLRLSALDAPVTTRTEVPNPGTRERSHPNQRCSDRDRWTGPVSAATTKGTLLDSVAVGEQPR